MKLVGLLNRLANYRRCRQWAHCRALGSPRLAAMSLLLVSSFGVTPRICSNKSLEGVDRLGQSTMRSQHPVDSVVMSPSLISDPFVLSWGPGVMSMHVH